MKKKMKEKKLVDSKLRKKKKSTPCSLSYNVPRSLIITGNASNNIQSTSHTQDSSLLSTSRLFTCPWVDALSTTSKVEEEEEKKKKFIAAPNTTNISQV